MPEQELRGDVHAVAQAIAWLVERIGVLPAAEALFAWAVLRMLKIGVPRARLHGRLDEVAGDFRVAERRGVRRRCH